MKNSIIFMLLLVLCACSDEEMTPSGSNANTVTSFSTFGKWQEFAPMITDSEGYLYTILDYRVTRPLSANLTDEFTTHQISLVKTNNRGALIWKVAIPEFDKFSRQLAIDEDDNIYIAIRENQNANMNAWFKVTSDGVSETLRENNGQTVEKDIRWLSEKNTIKSKDGAHFIKFDVEGGIVECYDYQSEDLEWSYNTISASGSSTYTDTDDEGNVYIAFSYSSSGRFIDVTEVKKLNSEGDEIATFNVPLLSGHIGSSVQGIKIFEGSFYLAMQSSFEVRDNLLMAFDGFRNEFINQAYIAKFNTNNGDQSWIQKLDSKYVQVDDEYIYEAYLDVLFPTTTVGNLIQDVNGNMWFNFQNYVRQDIGNTIGINHTFGGFESTIDAGNGGVTLYNLVAIKP